MALAVALIAVTGTAVSPLLLASYTGRQRRAELAETYRRQDEVAARTAAAVAAVAASQQLIAANQDQAAALLLAANERVAEATADVQSRLAQIHVLVNSQLTAAEHRELEATKALLGTMLELAALRRDGGTEPSVEAQDLIMETEFRVAALEASLAERAEVTERAAAARAAVITEAESAGGGLDGLGREGPGADGPG